MRKQRENSLPRIRRSVELTCIRVLLRGQLSAYPLLRRSVVMPLAFVSKARHVGVQRIFLVKSKKRFNFHCRSLSSSTGRPFVRRALRHRPLRR